MIIQKQKKLLRKSKKLFKHQHNEYNKVKRLNRQLLRLFPKYTDLKYNIVLESDKYFQEFESLDKLRQQVDSVMNSKSTTLSPRKIEKVRQLQKLIPSNILLDRIRLMDLLTLLPKLDENVDPSEYWLRLWDGKELQRQTSHKTKLRALNTKIANVYSDIKDIDKIFTYLDLHNIRDNNKKLLMECVNRLNRSNSNLVMNSIVDILKNKPILRATLHDLKN